MKPQAPIRVTEQMHGYVSRGAADYQEGFQQGMREGTALRFTLTLTIADVDRLVASPRHEVDASGGIVCEAFGGELPIEAGVFAYGFDPPTGQPKQMTYRLDFHDGEGKPLRLEGRKQLVDDPGFDVWSDTTTLYVDIVARDRDETVARGILRLGLGDVLAMVARLPRNLLPSAIAHVPRCERATFTRRCAALLRYGRFFFGGIWGIYRPRSRRAEARRRAHAAAHPYANHTLEGVAGAAVTTHYVQTEDKLTVSMLRFCRKPSNDVVLLVHGLTTSSDMFIMPEHRNLVTHLLDNGFTDVWCMDNRTSNRHPYNLGRHRYTLDHVALYDYPPALAAIRKQVPGVRVHVVCHCVGSLTFAMSLFGKAVDGISSVVSNSVALTPRVSPWARAKLAVSPFLIEYVLNLPYANPTWSDDPGFTPGEIVARIVSLFHRECAVPACHMLSLMWGSGRPALFNHANLADATHARLGDLFGGSGMHYYRHIRAMVRANNTAVKYAPHDARFSRLPDDYFDHAREISTPILFLTGDQNHIFTNSNVLCFERLKAIAPNLYELAVLPGYGHQDVFMGKRAADDVFPRITDFLRRHATPTVDEESAREAG